MVEDDKDVIDVLRNALEAEEYSVHVAKDGLDAVEQASRVLPDLVLLDLNIPKMHGIEVCKRLRSDPRLRDIPLIILSGKGDEEDKIAGLETGADDYVTKPFRPKELVARIRANLRRVERKALEKQYVYGDITVDTIKHEVFFNGAAVELTAREFELLVYLIENKGRILTRDMILNHVWGYDYFGTTRTVDVHITHLRQKISILAEAITTIKPLGYKLAE